MTLKLLQNTSNNKKVNMETKQTAHEIKCVD